MSGDFAQLSIKDLLGGQERYSIPMYQRNYAWEEAEITQLIQDVIDYVPEQKNYYIGTLMVFERRSASNVTYETIDGQQRLTTLSLLASYLKNEEKLDMTWYDSLKIEFNSRENSQHTFDVIFADKFDNDPAELLNSELINSGILNGYRLIKKILPRKLTENKVTTEQFSDYLLQMVQIMRVKVPDDTDLNHYFEVMNNRGEQLEKHEILKSRLMEILNDDPEFDSSRDCLHQVWEACANMESYVQLGFDQNVRHRIFGKNDWGSFELSNFDELNQVLKESKPEAENITLTVTEIIKARNVGQAESESEEAPERFNAVINFPNFLLHVLRIMLQEDIPLDDKRLISTFETYLLDTENPIKLARDFVFALLKCKYLFDHYVIKREIIGGKEERSLKRYKWYKNERSQSDTGSYVNTFGEKENTDPVNRRILMLLSAFHESSPTPVYKHWMNAALHHLYYSDNITSDDYLGYMESLARAFVFDRFLVQENGADYFDIIFKNNGKCETDYHESLVSSIEPGLRFGAIRNNLVFNYLDYLLWRKHATDSNIGSFEFTARSSVEHYYPQKPMADIDKRESELLDDFGNLCLISHSKNSKLSNYMPDAKKNHYRNNQIDSVKQYLMMKYSKWDKEEILEHSEAMRRELVDSLRS